MPRQFDAWNEFTARVDDSFKHITTEIGGVFKSQTEAMKLSIKPMWLHVWECLVDAANTPKPPAENKSESSSTQDFALSFDFWIKFGGYLGIDKDDLLKEEAELRKKAMNGLVGCSWVKCPLFRDETVGAKRKMLKCTRCRAVR